MLLYIIIIIIIYFLCVAFLPFYDRTARQEVRWERERERERDGGRDRERSTTLDSQNTSQTVSNSYTKVL